MSRIRKQDDLGGHGPHPARALPGGPSSLLGLALVLGTHARAQEPPPARDTRPAPQAADHGGATQDPAAGRAPDDALTAADQDSPPRRLELRATAFRDPDLVTVDRGERDGVAIGDPARFFPREGPPLEARVVEVRGRTAVVQLLDRRRGVSPGTRGEVLARPRPAPAPPLAAPEEEPAPGSAGGPVPTREHEPWEDDLDGWSSDQPLLASIRPLRPEERDSTWSGRAYLGFDTWSGSRGDRSDHLARAGGSLLVENPWAQGGRLAVDLELNQAYYESDGVVEQDVTLLRIDRLSYAVGGDRHSPTRYELGRFLQWGVPEFGLLDGAEITHREEDGSSYGASLGFTPEPNRQQGFSQDAQLAAHYRWVSDPGERLSLLAGLQRTLYDNETDRTLLLGKLAWRPDADWDVWGTLWVDHDPGGDTTGSNGLQVTRAWLTARHRFDQEAELEVAYRHRTYADLLRDPNLQESITANLLDRREDRLRLGGSAWIDPDRRLYGYASVWSDTAADGHDLEAGVDARRLVSEWDRLDLALVTSRGEFEQVTGGRVQYGRSGQELGWSLLYELLYSDHLTFVNDQDALTQHRLRGSLDLQLEGGWSLSLYAQGLRYADDDGWSLGFFLQRSF